MGRGRYGDTTLTLSDAPPPKNAGAANVSKIKSAARSSGGISKRSKDPTKKAVQLLLQQTKNQKTAPTPTTTTPRPQAEAKWRKYFPRGREKKVAAKNVASNERVLSRRRRPDPSPRKRPSASPTSHETPSTSDGDRAKPQAYEAPREKKKVIPVLNIANPSADDTNGVNRMKFFAHHPKRCDDPQNADLMGLSPFAYTASLIEGHCAASVCAVCGNGDALSFSCNRCMLSFHTPCIYPHLKPNDPTPKHCRACASSPGEYDIAKPRVLGLRRLTEDALNGNSIDFVLHPSLQTVFAKRYQSDWLRCSKCHKFRMVPSSCLSECVQTPFECSSAFWTGEPISCASPETSEHKVTSKAVNALVNARSRRRVRLFYSGFGDKHRELFGFDAMDKAAVASEHSTPYRKNTLRPNTHPIANPPPLKPRARPPHRNPRPPPKVPPPTSQDHKTGPSPVTQAPYAQDNKEELHALPGAAPPARLFARGPGAAPTQQQPRQAPVDPMEKELAEERILSRIGEMQNLGPLEDILVDLAMTGNREMMRLYKAFWHCPSRFNRQAIRLATFFFQRQNKPRAPVVQRPKPTRPQSLPPTTPGIQKAPSLRERRLTTLERNQLHERFREIRLQQIAECVRLGQAMYKEMHSSNRDDVPKTHRSHAMAKRMMEDEHNKQIQKLVQAAHAHTSPSSPQPERSQPGLHNNNSREGARLL